MRFLDEMKDSCVGQELILICGGVSSVSELYRLPEKTRESAMYAGVNQHANINPFISWIYAHDEEMVQFLQKQEIDIPILSHKKRFLRENDIHAGISPYVKLSGAEACWCADYLGYKKIYVLGVDAYNNRERAYWHQYEEKQDRGEHYKAHNRDNLKPWRQCFEQIRHPERFVFYNKKFLDLQKAFTSRK